MTHSPTIDDDVLGTLTFESDTQLYNGSLDVGGRAIDVHVSSRRCDDVRSLVDTVSSHATHIEELARNAISYAATTLVDVKNRGWLQEDEPPISSEQFERRLTLRALTAYAGKGVDLWFADDGLFWGHDVAVRVDFDGQFVDADLVG